MTERNRKMMHVLYFDDGHLFKKKKRVGCSNINQRVQKESDYIEYSPLIYFLSDLFSHKNNHKCA